MIELHGPFKTPKLTKYEICSNRGGKFWGTEVLEVIGYICNGSIEFDTTHSPEELRQTQDLWNVLSITEKF